LSNYGAKVVAILKRKRFLIIIRMDKDYSQNTKSRTTSIAIIAIVAALGVLGVVIVLAVVTLPVQEAEAGCERGAGVNKSFVKSNGKCFDRGTF
jgi:hypothetical protein